VNRSEPTDAYNGTPGINRKVQVCGEVFPGVHWMQVQGENAAILLDSPNNDFADKMTHVIWHHYSESAKNVSRK
jgi:hypothetical protein